MSRWNTRQMSSAKFCQLDRILPNSASTNVPVKSTLDWILLNSADLINFCQVLPSSARLYRSLLTTACVRAHASPTRTMTISLWDSRVVPFFSLRNVLFFTRAIPLDLDRIYIIPLNLPWSLFAPLHFWRSTVVNRERVETYSHNVMYYGFLPNFLNIYIYRCF